MHKIEFYNSPQGKINCLVIGIASNALDLIQKIQVLKTDITLLSCFSTMANYHSLLLHFDCFLVETHWGSKLDQDLFGDFLADAVNAHKGVIVCAYTNCAYLIRTQFQISGRFKTLNYHPLQYSEKKYIFNCGRQKMEIVEPRHENSEWQCKTI